ncbi:hypothetical protein [Zoogloea sp.]|jgi:hypothetical protein|uniref:hypothetical protein n=1 Tax=Zoogloea sp. TaxID=49181 RepID=UPI0025F9B0F1|nr:hypothetical protein [Zoogloea sp.]MCK6395617.1 hypothetical protein [Zoogloea sp.]
MDKRQITSLMQRLFYGDLGPAEYVHLAEGNELNRVRVDALLEQFIPGDQLLFFVNSQNCSSGRRDEAFEKIQRLLQVGRVKVADPRFEGKVVIDPLGVGAGVRSNPSFKQTPDGAA